MPEKAPTGASAILTWPELAQQEEEKTEISLRFMRESVPETMAALSQKALMSSEFAGLDETLARGIALYGANACQSAVSAVAPYLHRAVREITRILNQGRPRLALWLISYVNAVRCCAGELPSEANDLEARWLSRLTRRATELDETTLQTAALAALALGHTDWVTVFTGGEPLSANFVPGQTFGPNIQGFTRYLAMGLQASAKAQAVEPAWNHFVVYFPAKLSAGTVSWSDLLWCGRAMSVGFEGQPVESVGRMLHEMVS